MIRDSLTYKIIGCAMKVHNTIGNGFQEVIYQRCMAIEMGKAGLQYGREVEQPIYYSGIEVGTRRADFIVENRVVVELKALVALKDVHLAQARNYVVAYDFPIGLLINFGAKSLEYKRIFNDRKAKHRGSKLNALLAGVNASNLHAEVQVGLDRPPQQSSNPSDPDSDKQAR